ncbi:homeobox protein 2-like [Condylostylus longicornis]|uniref:homeobox protein 2-like n=1 Tax=Condylostylus longicornis TaxID=2530218 RepID=UPI00244E0482|nr:homeobox protein 2-like [Condylostylus longicornis]
MSFNNRNDNENDYSNNNDDTNSENFHTIDYFDISNNNNNENINDNDNNFISPSTDKFIGIEKHSYSNKKFSTFHHPITDNIHNIQSSNVNNDINILNNEYKPITKVSYNVLEHSSMFKDVYLKYHYHNDEEAGQKDEEDFIKEYEENKENADTERILSRSRRYLTFPEGSSFQIVWDGIVPIVDYNNYLILGITVALAWALPSDPPSEIIENVVNKLNNGTLGLQRNYNNFKWNKNYIDNNNRKYTEGYHNKFKKNHIIIPVFGKRKKRDIRKYHYDPLQIVDILYHRQSRFILYDKIEKFLNE